MRSGAPPTRPVALRVLAALVAAAAATACASLLGIEELPLVGADAASQPPDAGADACVPRGRSFCERTCPVPDFCEDFELGSPLETWRSPPGTPQPLADGTQSLVVAEDDAGGEGRTLQARATGSGTSGAAAFYSHLLNPVAPAPVGMRVTAKVRLYQFTLLAHEAGIPSDRYAGGIILSGARAGLAGLSLLFHEVRERPDQVRITISQRELGGSPPVDLARIYDIESDFVVKNPFELDATLGTAATFERLGLRCDAVTDAGPEVTRLLVRFLNRGLCIALEPPLADPRWLDNPLIGAGVFVSEELTAEFRLDNIAVTVIR